MCHIGAEGLAEGRAKAKVLRCPGDQEKERKPREAG